MGDDWDPFADPADASGGEDEGQKAEVSVNAFSCEPDADLLQPWEVDKPGSGKEVSELQYELAALTAPLCAADIPVSIGPLRPVPRLTKEQAMALEDMLIAAYQTEEFQRQLHESWHAAGWDPRLQGKARQEVCLPVQVPIVVMFGFEASRRGVTQSVGAFVPFSAEPEIVARNNLLAWLVNPALQMGVLPASGKRLAPSEELIDSALAGNVGAVRAILEGGGDPNTVILREERLKGSDGCCSCTITSEEYTPLIAACMFQHEEVVNMVLDHRATDVNLVCAGINQEFGPYKSYSALDIARRCMRGSPIVERLESMGARPAEELPEPPYPRPKSEGTPEPPPKAEPPPKPEVPPASVAPLPAVEKGEGAVEQVTGEIVERMRAARGDVPSERLRLFRQLVLEWHPDKRPESERGLATAVCQWLVGPAKCFVGRA